MVRRLRDAPGRAGLLYGQGEFVTKHHALVLGTVDTASAGRPRRRRAILGTHGKQL
jgi:hypothetical protein